MATLKLFAGLREAAGTSEAEIDSETLGALLDKARKTYGPAFSAQLDRAKVALNGAEIPHQALKETTVGPGDEVALIPPVSGGATDAAGRAKDPALAAFALSGVLAAAAVLLSWVSAGLLSLYVALLAGSITFNLANKMPGSAARAGALASALAAAAFPFWLLTKGERGLMWGAGFAVFLVAASLLLLRRAEGAVVSAGRLVWLPLYVGFGLSFALLLRQQGEGPGQLLSVALMLLAYKGSALLVSRVGVVRDGRRQGVDATAVGSRLAGIAAAEVAAMVSLAFLGEPHSAGPLAILGLIVGLAAMLGDAFGRSVAADPSCPGLTLHAWTGLDAWLLALPAFFYGFRLYLT